MRVDDVRAELARHPGVEWERGQVVGLGANSVAEDFETHREVMVELGWTPR